MRGAQGSGYSRARGRRANPRVARRCGPVRRCPDTAVLSVSTPDGRHRQPTPGPAARVSGGPPWVLGAVHRRESDWRYGALDRRRIGHGPGDYPRRGAYLRHGHAGSGRGPCHRARGPGPGGGAQPARRGNSVRDPAAIAGAHVSLSDADATRPPGVAARPTAPRAAYSQPKIGRKRCGGTGGACSGAADARSGSHPHGDSPGQGLHVSPDL